jgi:trehalose utilization protein
MPIRVTVWHEYRHERNKPGIAAVYPEGIHVVIKAALEKVLGDEVVVRTATLDEPDHGLPESVLQDTDVMLWWGHGYHAEVQDLIALKVVQRVREGMGLIVLHSGHYSKPFKLLMGTHCHLKWREAAEKERIWVVSPGHPITAGLTSDCIEIEHEEMYGEHFDIPDPDELIFISWFEGGEIFRSGCVWKRGAGRIFYFRPGHESFPTFYRDDIQRVIANGVRYVAPTMGVVPYRNNSPNIVPAMEPIKSTHQVDQSLHEHANRK